MATILDKLVAQIGFQTDLSGLRRFESGIKRLRSRVNSVANLSIRVGAGLTAAAAAPLMTFANYEEAMAKIQGLVGISQEQLEDWQDQIEAIGRETGKGPLELANALFFITSSGADASVAMDILRHSARASAAGLGDQAVIADLLTSAMLAYKDSGLTAAEATDILTNAVRLGKLEPATLAAALGRLLPLASAMGMTFGEATGMLAAMSRTGTSAEEAVTQINAVLAALLKPGEEAEKALAEVGLTMDDLRAAAAGEQGLFGALRMLDTAFAGNRDEMARVFPNIRALRGIFDLLGGGLEGNIQLLREMRNSTGVADEAFQAASDTLKFQALVALSVLKFQLLEIGELMRPTAEAVLNFATDALLWFDNLDEGSKKTVARILTFGPALIGAGVAVKVFSFALDGLLPVLRLFRGMLSGLRLLFLTAFGPVGLTAAALAAAALLIKDNWGAIGQFFEDRWADIQAAFPGAAQFFEDLWGEVAKPVEGIFDWVKTAWQETVDWLKGPGEDETTFDWLKRPIEGAYGWAKTAWQEVLDFIRGDEEAGDPSLWRRITTGITGAFGWVETQWDTAINYIKAGPGDDETVFAWLMRPVVGLFDWVREAWRSVISWLKGEEGESHALGEEILDPGEVVAGNMFGWVRRAWRGVLEWFKGDEATDTSVFGWLSRPVEGIFDWVRSGWQAVLGWFRTDGEGTDPTIFDWLAEPVEGVFQWVRDAWSGIKSWFKGEDAAVFDESTGEYVFPQQSGIFAWVRTAWRDVLGWFKSEEGQDPGIFAWLSEPVVGVFDWVTGAWQGMTAILIGPERDLWTWLKEEVLSPFGWVVDAWDAMIGDLKWPEDAGPWVEQLTTFAGDLVARLGRAIVEVNWITALAGLAGSILESLSNIIASVDWAKLGGEVAGFLRDAFGSDEAKGGLNEGVRKLFSGLGDLFVELLRAAVLTAAGAIDELLGTNLAGYFAANLARQEAIAAGQPDPGAPSPAMILPSIPDIAQRTGQAVGNVLGLPSDDELDEEAERRLREGRGDRGPVNLNPLPWLRQAVEALRGNRNPVDEVATLPVGPISPNTPGGPVEEFDKGPRTINIELGGINIEGGNGSPEQVAEAAADAVEDRIKKVSRAIFEQTATVQVI